MSLANYVVQVDMGIYIDDKEPIGEGDYATVYRGYSSYGTNEMKAKLNWVAVKVFKPEVLKDPTRHEYVKNEVENGRMRATKGSLQTEHLLPIFAVHQPSELELHIIMPLRRGSLEDLLQRPDDLKFQLLREDPHNWALCKMLDEDDVEGTLRRSEAMSRVQQHRYELAEILLPQMLSGLESLHSHNIAHRDLKPTNILYRTRPYPRSIAAQLQFCLADFGPTRDLTLHDAQSDRGSRFYLAPEVYKGTTRSSPATVNVDIWAAFATMIYTLDLYRPSRKDLKLSYYTPYGHVLSIARDMRESFWEPIFTNMCNEDPEERGTAEFVRTKLYPLYVEPPDGLVHY